MQEVQVLVVGGGPVGMTLAHELAVRGVRCMLVERNPDTTAHPKMDITNSRSMELFRRSGLSERLRAAAVAEDHPFDVAWITTLAGHELHRFGYESPARLRRRIQENNDGSSPVEPPMRVSQIIIEPVLKTAIDNQKLVKVRFGVAFERLEELADGVLATVRDLDKNISEQVLCRYLVGCDGGNSQVREQLGVGLTGEARLAKRFITHFHSDARTLLQRWGVAWHYQSALGTLVAQDDHSTWTLLSRLPDEIQAANNPGALLTQFAGTGFDHRIIVSNAWSPHLLVADRYGRGRVLLAGDAVHQYIPTGGYGMNTGIGDAFDLGWKLAALVQGWGGPALLASYEIERRPIGLRNCAAARRHNQVRVEIAQLYNQDIFEVGAIGAAARARVAHGIAELGNAENESAGIEMGYSYEHSPIICEEVGVRVPSDPLRYAPTTIPGVRLPNVFLADSSAVFDLLGPWFTLLMFGPHDAEPFIAAALSIGAPLMVRRLDPALKSLYAADLVLVRPDHHVAWRGGSAEHAASVLARVTGWA